ncbi:MAG: hypothetical protein ABUL48_05165 [Pseudorhodoplanes sp.]
MIRIFAIAGFLAFGAAQAAAQNSVMGGVLLGGVATSRTNPAAQLEAGSGRYVWSGGRCWYRFPSGKYKRVWRWRCRT